MAKRGSDQKPKAPEFHNNPFKDLKKVLAPKPEAAPQQSKQAAPPPPPKPKKGSAAPDDEEEMFLMAMGGVTPIVNRGSAAPPPKDLRPKIASDEAEALAQLAELVTAQGAFTVVATDSAIEAAAPGVDQRLIASVRKGNFPVQGKLDVTKVPLVDAPNQVERFLADARRDGKRCVLLVLSTAPDARPQLPVLKDQLKGWISRGRIAKSVLAFATARPQDGGAGALYVLLRRER